MNCRRSPTSVGGRRLFIGFISGVLMQANPESRGEIFVVDNDADARTALAGALTLAGYEVIFFADGAGLLARAKTCMPLCVFLDVGMRGKCRFDLLDRLRAGSWRVPIFATSVKGNIAMAVEAIRKGAFDFIEKPFDGCDIVKRVSDAIDETPLLLSDTALQFQDGASFTEREWEVLEGIASGETTKQIARRLGRSSRTVDSYRANILRKAGARNSTELLRRMLVPGR
jgi:two-component system, LuxR family, response regulator FixJ